MHTPAPPDTQTAPAVHLPQATFRGRPRAGFSLIEVTLAIAVVAFSFVALIGLLPAGMSVFNQTMDSTNEMRISSDLVSMLQATDYEKLATVAADTIYYYDVDGGTLDTSKVPKSSYESSRIYSAKIVFDEQYLQPSALKFNRERVAVKAILAIGKYNEAVNTYLGTLNTTDDVHRNPPPGHRIKLFPILITKMDGQN
jgi:uncharacterized protein (TIGR02598 family)